MAPSNQVSRAAVCRSGPPLTTSRGQPCPRFNQAPSGSWQERQHFFDLGTPELPEHIKDLLPPPEETADGFLIVHGVAARGDCIYTYVLSDGSLRREYRPGSVVFDGGALATFRGIPVTLDHPGEMVTPDTDSKVRKGAVLEPGVAYPKFGIVVVPMVLQARELIDAFHAGQRALSTGELILVEEAPGEVDGQPYDTRLLALRFNHLAFVDMGMAGPLAQARANQRFNRVTPQLRLNRQQETPMEFTIIVVNGIEYSVPVGQEEAWRNRLNQAHAQIPEEVQERLNTATGQLAIITAERDELQATVEELKANNPGEGSGGSGEQFEERLNSAVAERVADFQQVLTKALPLFGDGITTDETGEVVLKRKRFNKATKRTEDHVTKLVGLGPEDILREAVLARWPAQEERLNGKGRGYLEARVDMLLEHKEASDRSANTLERASATARLNALDDDPSAEAKSKAAEAHNERAKKWSS